MKHKYLIIATLGIVLWLAETAYFGWNDKPESGAEKGLDILSSVLIIWGIIGDILTNVTITKKAYNTHNINNVEKFIVQKPKEIRFSTPSVSGDRKEKG